MTRGTIEDILAQGTDTIELLGIITGGKVYAEMLFPSFKGRAKLFSIDPRDEVMQYPGTNPSNTLVICDDAIQSGYTLNKVLAFLGEAGYSFNSGVYVAVACDDLYQERLDLILPANHVSEFYPNVKV